MEVLPCPVNVDFSNTRGKDRSIPVSCCRFPSQTFRFLAPPPFQASVSPFFDRASRCSQLTTPAGISWFLFAARFVSSDGQLERFISSFRTQTEGRRFYVLYSAKTRIIASVFSDGAREKRGGGCPSLLFFLSMFFDCSYYVYIPLTDYPRRVFIHRNFPDI